MGKRKFQLSDGERQEIYEILKRSHDDPVYDRLRAVLYYASGSPTGEITTAFSCSRSTLLGWCDQYRRFGPEGLVSLCRGGNNAFLDDTQLADLTRRLWESTPRQVLGKSAATDEGQVWTVQDLYQAVRLWYGVVYRSPTSYYRLLKRFAPK